MGCTARIGKRQFCAVVGVVREKNTVFVPLGNAVGRKRRPILDMTNPSTIPPLWSITISTLGMSGSMLNTSSLADLNSLPRSEFVGELAGIFEHSPWVAEAVVDQRPFSSRATLFSAMEKAVRSAGPDHHLALIRAHPDLAGRLAREGRLTPESAREQAAAGLTGGDPAIRDKLAYLNAAYRGRFGFPFVICARLNQVEKILSAMERRLHHTPEAEISAALEEIFQIARLRLEDRVTD